MDRGASVPNTIYEGFRQSSVDFLQPMRHRGDPELKRIVEFAASAYSTAIAAISIIDRERQILLSRTGIDLWETTRAAAFCATAVRRPGEPLVVPDATLDDRFADNPSVLFAPHVRFYAGMPIVDRGGYALGALCVVDTAPRRGEPDLLQLMLLAREAERLIAR